MKRWFDRLPIHRKLVVMALTVTTAALLLAMFGLTVNDLWRYRASALLDTQSLAQVISQNTAAAVTFKDQEAAEESLATVRVRPAVRRACIYLPDGSLFASYARTKALACDPAGTSRQPWSVTSNYAPIMSRNRTVGQVYLESDLTGLQDRITLAATVGLAMLLLAAALAYALAHRLHRTVSAPIAQLAAAARAIGADGPQESLAGIPAPPDEVGALVRAFQGMVGRLLESNEALRKEVDERKRIEAEREDLLRREREANRLKDEFLAAVSHELRTPLNAMMGWVQILGATTPNAQTMAKALASITRNARAQTRVIEDLVDVSRIVTGKLTLRFERVDLRSVVDSAVDSIRPSADARQITLTVMVPAAECPVNGDRDRLQQVAWNLLANAVKFTAPGGTVSITLAEHEQVCELNVSDTGVGIPAAFLPHVFDRFRQADGSITREHGGLGLGLSIVKELTELHGGSVSVASDGEGRGATFTIRLPRVDGDEAAAQVAAAVTPDALLTGVRVLVVDDNQDAQDIVAAMLRHADATVRVAGTGDEALQAWHAEPPDVLLCDLAMPKMNGIDLLGEIRRLDAAAGRRTAAIALTAHVSSDDQARVYAAGFDYHLGKPCDAAALVRTVRRAMERV